MTQSKQYTGEAKPNLFWIKAKTVYQTTLHCSLLACIWLLSHHVHAVGTMVACGTESAIEQPQYDGDGFNKLLDDAERKLAARGK